MPRADRLRLSRHEGQIFDATVAPAPKQRNTKEERAAIKQGNNPEPEGEVRQGPPERSRWALGGQTFQGPSEGRCRPQGVQAGRS